MRGKRSGPTGKRGAPPFKKIKRSKKFWQQRQTAEFAPTPVDEEDNDQSEVEDEGDEANKNVYQTLIEAFSTDNKSAFVESGDSDEEQQSVDSEDDADNDDKNSISEHDSDDEEEVEAEEEVENSNSDLEQESEVDETDNENEDSDAETDLSENDHFLARVSAEIPEEVQSRVNEKKDLIKYQGSWKNIGQFLSQSPTWKSSKKRTKVLLDDPSEESGSDVNERLCKIQEKLVNFGLVKPSTIFSLKPQLKENLALANIKSLGGKLTQPLTDFQSEMMGLLSSYKDLLYCEQTLDNLEQIRTVYVLHALNHMMKTRSKILKNNSKISKNPKASVNIRDQGLCRPKILIVLPFQESARRVIDLMGKLMFGKIKGGNIANKKRFDEEFGTEPKGLEKLKESGRKPDDFYELFSGDTDDGYKLGLAVTKKTLKLYTDFYSSDIILASPLGLRMVIGVEGEAKRDYDFLNSIEMVIFDQMDVLAMQNWDHVSHIFEHLHLQPTQSHGADFSRVRMWTLNGLSKMYRQTILLSSTAMPEINAILNKDCRNYCGTIRIANPVRMGSISRVSTSVPMVFHRFDTDNAGRSVDDRFDYFTNRIMPDFKKDAMYHTLVFVPSYFDFVRVRNWFNLNDLDFAEISEYTREKKVAEARDHFFHSERHFVLYSERAHFYRRYAIKGIRHLIFYQLPQTPNFFSELCNLMQFQNKKGGSDGNMSCTVLYCKYDVHRVSPVVATERAKTMLSASKSVHMFSGKEA